MIDFDILLQRIVREDRYNKRLRELESQMIECRNKISEGKEGIGTLILHDSFNLLLTNYYYIDMMNTLDGLALQLAKSNTVLLKKMERLENRIKMMENNT